jgi:hypothetical protein
VPLRLPQLLYLLSYEPARNRMDVNSAAVRGPLLRAAAVADLRIAGHLEDRDGRATRTDAPVPDQLDPFLREVLDDIPPDRPRRWFRAIEQRWHNAEGSDRDQLAAEEVITIERGRTLLVLPSERIAVTVPPPRSPRSIRAGGIPADPPTEIPVPDGSPRP